MCKKAAVMLGDTKGKAPVYPWTLVDSNAEVVP